MYNMSDYRKALADRDSKDFNSAAWDIEQAKVQSIVSVMVASKSSEMVSEVVDEVYSLNDCGATLDDKAVQFDIWLLESNGYTAKAEEFRNLDWN